jgi:uncharacterized protein (TIGR00251 family)
LSSQQFFSRVENGVRLKLHVQPGASRSELAGTHGEALKLRISARAESGEANKAICAFLAELLSVPKTSINISHGLASRQKTIFIQGDADQIMLTLENCLKG